MTDNTQSGSDTNVTRKDTSTEVGTHSNKGVQAELDYILAKHNGELGVTWEDPDVVTPDTKQAILDWHKKHELQARIDELNGLPHRSVTALTSSVDQSVIYERIAELKQELEKL